jgi:hypothetical protein
MTEKASLRSAVVTVAKQLGGPAMTVKARCLMRGYGLPRWGNLRRTSPFSSTYGFERGQPIDRYYLHKFLAAHRDLITGDVLEIQGTSYAERFGRGLTRADSFDIEPRFDPTYLCDFADSANVIPDHAYDCLLLPNALTFFRQLDRCLAHALRVVRPGGAILASVAGLLPLTGDVAEYWRLTPSAWRDTLAAAWPDATLDIAGHGNCLSAIGAQLGLALEELTAAELDVHDPRFPVLTTILCRLPR